MDIFLSTYFGGEIINNDVGIIKGKVDSSLYSVFKNLLGKLNMTQQDFIDQKVKEFIIEHINVVVDKKSDSK